MRYILLAGLVAGALLGYYVLWSHLADQVAAQATAWIDSQRRLGREVSHGRWRLWGFPYRLSLTVEQARWSDPQHPLGLRLETDEITAHLQFWDLHHVIFDLPGAQRLAWREAGADRQLGLQSEQFRASLVLDGAGTWLRAAADLGKPRLTGAGQDWTADRLLLHARRAGNVPPEADLSLQADAILLPPQAEGPLGRSIAQLKLVGTARGSAYGRTAEELLGSWRDSGGVIDLQTVSLAWGRLRLDGDGSLTLDRQFRPLGAMGGQLRGADAGIDALVAAGRMKPNEAAAAKAMLTLVTKTDAKGEAYLPVPLTAQEGKLFLGPAPLFTLPSVLPQ